MASETIVAVFETTAAADAAAHELESAGIRASAIKRYTNQSALPQEDVAVGRTQHRGFWSWLLGEEVPEQGYAAYNSALERGGEVLTVISEESEADRVVSILEKHSPIELEGEGATQASAGVSSGSRTAFEGEQVPPASLGSVNEGVAGYPPAGTTATSSAAPTANEQVVPLAEERLNVGKKTVERGTTRLRRYVVERPVEEQIRLRDETVSVERRPVSGTASVAADAFTEKTVEVTETREEPVVEKVARVVEEVTVGKKQTERVETVRDTVRREEVDIDRPSDGPVTSSHAISAKPAGSEPPIPPVER